MKTAKRILTVALALMLIFAMAAPSFALQSTGYVPVENGSPYYIQGADSLYEMDGEFTVYLSLFSEKKDGNGPINVVLPVQMGSSTATDVKYTVDQVLTAAETQYPVYDFDIRIPYSGHDSWLQGITYIDPDPNVPDVTYEAMPLKKDGTTYYGAYMFRINGMLPFFTHTNSNNQTVTEGCTITDAYVTANDVIDFYYQNVYSPYATKVRYVAYLGTVNGVSTFQVLVSECYMSFSDTDWTLTNWAPVTNTNYIKIKLDGGNATYYSTDQYGKFTISGLTSGTHSIQFNTTTRQFKYTENNVNKNYDVANVAGMYSRFIIQ